MNNSARKRSPRAPSMALDDAIDRVLKIYEKERRHPAPADVFAQNMGYKNAANGAALSALASLRYFGLADRVQEGLLVVSKDVESYKFAPNDQMRRELVVKWLKTPPLFVELLVKYEGGLPSDATLKYDLIQRGFNPATADACLSVFRRSVDYAHYYELQTERGAIHTEHEEAEEANHDDVATPRDIQTHRHESVSEEPVPTSATGTYRIPVRLGGGRMAWIEIPTMPFYSADKDRLKAQIDFLLTDDEEEL